MTIGKEVFLETKKELKKATIAFLKEKGCSTEQTSSVCVGIYNDILDKKKSMPVKVEKPKAAKPEVKPVEAKPAESN